MLSPTRHAPINEARITLVADFGTETESLHDSGPHGINQRVRTLDQAQDRFHALRMLEVDGHGGAPASPHVGFRTCKLKAESCRLGPINTDDVRTHIREQR
jgi:hypothetical protein